MTLSDIVSMIGGELRGEADHVIGGINTIELAGPGDVTFLTSDKYARYLATTKAGCVLVTRGIATDEEMAGKNVIVMDDAYRGFVLLMQKFFPPMTMQPGYRAATAFIHPAANVHESASIGPGCVVERGCTVGKNVQLFANVILYPEVHIGEGTIIHANVVCAQGTQVGERCIIHAGAVLGSDGFGFLENTDGSYEKIPQVGIVKVGNAVEIGANTTIDRAAVGATVIEDGVKLDNLIHVAHGVTIGRDTAIAAQTGISGSTKIGKRNRIAGQVGIVGHITTADDVTVIAQSGVSKSITASDTYFGSPAKHAHVAMRIEAALRSLPDLLQQFRELQKRVDELSKSDE